MNWKKENPYYRYIDDITDEEAVIIAKLALGLKNSDEITITNIFRKCNANNIPHVEITLTYFDTIVFEDIETTVGIFENLNVYLKNYHSPWCQKKIFEFLNKQRFNDRKITSEILIENGFVHIPSLIEDSYQFVIENIDEKDSWIPGKRFYRFKGLSASMCNDKGQGEYYLFLREGSSEKRHEDNLVTLTRDLQFESDLKDFLRLIK